MRINRPEEPAYSGGITYHKVPLALAAEELKGADVAIVGAPMDDLVSHRPGTRFGPREIRMATDVGGPPHMWHMDLGIDPFAHLNVVDYGDAAVVPGDGHVSHSAVKRAVGDIVAAGAVPIVLGGDHSITYPNVAAVTGGRAQEDLAIVHFDTHADTADELHGLRWTHGSPFRRIVEDGLVRADRLVQIGLRGYWPFPKEFAWMRKVGVRWHRMDEIERRGIEVVMDDVVREIDGASRIFVSVDIDVLDPAYAPGTGTPEPGGMTTRELLRAVRTIVAAKPLAGMDLVEVSPPYDHASITALAAHRVVMEALSALASVRSGKDPAPEDP